MSGNSGQRQCVIMHSNRVQELRVSLLNRDKSYQNVLDRSCLIIYYLYVYVLLNVYCFIPRPNLAEPWVKVRAMSL